MDSSPGILTCGRYLPRLRIARATIAEANRWLAPRAGKLVSGTRTFCDWDEDSVTMATAAARNALRPADYDGIESLFLASTTLPFAERQNAGIVAAALALNHRPIAMLDVTGSARAATSALISAAGRTDRGNALVAAADRRSSRPNSFDELTNGHGAAAVLVGCGSTIARVVAMRSTAEDMLDFVRASDHPLGVGWEERWVRDEIIHRIVPRAIAAALNDAGIAPGDVAHLVLPLPHIGGAARVATAAGIPAAALADDFADVCGNTGAAHALFMLCNLLERAKPDEIVLIVGLGQGCDTIIVRTTNALPAWQRSRHDAAPSPMLVDDYTRFLFNLGQLEPDLGLRHRDRKMLPFSAVHRHRDHALGLIGGRCRSCGTFQLPKSRICVAPDCRTIGDQDDVNFARLPGRVASWTADYLVASRAPPAIYGTVHFDPGGSYIFNFADVREDEMNVGKLVQMVFRVHDIDETTGIHNYFWKASLRTAASAATKE